MSEKRTVTCDRCGTPLPDPLDQYGRPALCVECWYDPPVLEEEEPDPPKAMTWQLWFGAELEIVEDEEQGQC